MWAVEPSRLANRSQLNRYLSGCSTPRPPLMRRDLRLFRRRESRDPFAAVRLRGDRQAEGARFRQPVAHAFRPHSGAKRSAHLSSLPAPSSNIVVRCRRPAGSSAAWSALEARRRPCGRGASSPIFARAIERIALLAAAWYGAVKAPRQGRSVPGTTVIGKAL